MTTVEHDAAFPWPTGWFSIGTADALQADGDHVTVDLPRLSVTVQNFRGALAGFLNVCSHRATQMRVCGRGNGLLRCPYHGWVYNQEGVPVGIPDNDRLFQLSAEARRGLALKPVAVARRGAFLVIALDPAGQSPDETDLPDLPVVAERNAVIDRPWRAILEGWLALPAARRGAANLVLETRGPWLTARHVVPLAAGRSAVVASLLHPAPAEAGAPPPEFDHALD